MQHTFIQSDLIQKIWVITLGCKSYDERVDLRDLTDSVIFVVIVDGGKLWRTNLRFYSSKISKQINKKSIYIPAYILRNIDYYSLHAYHSSMPKLLYTFF